MPSTALPFALTDRDLAMLDMVFAYGGLGVQHLQKRFFPTPGARAACYARIAKLVHAGYLAGQRLPSQTGLGSGRLFLTTGPAARPILARLRNCSVSELKRQTRMKAPVLLNHELAIVDVRLALELAVEASTVFTDVAWTPEWELRRHPASVADPDTQSSMPLVADASFILTTTGERGQEFLLEVDMATLSAKRLRGKLRGYLVRAQTQPMPVLWAAVHAARAAMIAQLAAEEARRLDADPTIFWVTTQASVNEQIVLAGPIWQVVGGPPALALESHAAASASVSSAVNVRDRQASGAP